MVRNKNMEITNIYITDVHFDKKDVINIAAELEITTITTYMSYSILVYFDYSIHCYNQNAPSIK